MNQIKNRLLAAQWFDRRVVAGVLILALILLIVMAGKEGLSNFYVQSASQEIERWSAPGQIFRGDEGTRATQYLTKSLAYSPHNPWSLEVAGMLLLRGMNAMRDAELAQAVARDANADFRAALAQRPTSPFSWANFALTKLYLDEQDDALFRSLEHAVELGAWEPEVQQAVVFVGLTVWNRLNPAQRDAVVLAMEHGAQRSQGKIFEIAKSFNRVDLFCALRYSGSQGREGCNSIQTPSPKTRPGR